MRSSCIRLLCVATMAVIASSATRTTASPIQSATSVWIGFRYDDTHVQFQTPGYDTTISMREVDRIAIKPPLDTLGVCGHLMPMPPDKLAEYRKSNAEPRIGQTFTLLLGGTAKITVTVDGFLEEWRGDPEVDLIVTARASGTDLTRLRNTHASAFLMSSASNPTPPPALENETISGGTISVLNSFDGFGDLVLRTGEAGRDITLVITRNGVRRSTGIDYRCVD